MNYKSIIVILFSFFLLFPMTTFPKKSSVRHAYSRNSRQSNQRYYDLQEYYKQELSLISKRTIKELLDNTELRQSLDRLIRLKADTIVSSKSGFVKLFKGKEYSSAPYSIYKEQLQLDINLLEKDFRVLTARKGKSHPFAHQIPGFVVQLKKLEEFIILSATYDEDQKFLHSAKSSGSSMLSFASLALKPIGWFM